MKSYPTPEAKRRYHRTKREKAAAELAERRAAAGLPLRSPRAAVDARGFALSFYTGYGKTRVIFKPSDGIEGIDVFFIGEKPQGPSTTLWDAITTGSPR